MRRQKHATFNDFWDVCAYGKEVDIVTVFVNVFAKHLLTLFVHGVNVVDDDHFLFPIYHAMGLTEGFEFTAEKTDALFFQIVHIQNVVFRDGLGGRQLIIFAYEGVQENGFARTRVSDEQNVEVVHVQEGVQHRLEFGRGKEPIQRIRLVFGNEQRGIFGLGRHFIYRGG